MIVLDASAVIEWLLYVALAEVLDGTLVTRDGRIARAPGLRASVDVIS